MSMTLEKIVSGGQTGVDRAALEAALDIGLSHGGWCPKGRLAEDGIISKRFHLIETESKETSDRTRLNVKDSDGTLILAWGALEGGTKLTADFARQFNKPWLIIDLQLQVDLEAILTWIKEHSIETLNIAGPKASESSDIFPKAYEILTQLFKKVKLIGQ